MPVPWGKTHKASGPDWNSVKRIQHAENRAISLRQLKELQEYCQRLCKAGLLKYEDNEFNRRLDRCGKRVKWTQLTQHEICSLIIKKIIPKEESLSCSWVDVVAQGDAQPCSYFCSHNWGECFRDFMVSIEAHARDKGVGLEETYWVCVYANNQHNVELGKTLDASPFYQALKGAQATLLMLDKTAEALLRLWCVFELNETLLTLRHKLELWTPLGKVGSGLVSSGPVVQALRRIDTCHAQATDDVDQRQILNHIAKVGEVEGIRLKQDGTKELVEYPEEYQKGRYERELVKKHRDEFEGLNSAIIRSVQTAIEEPNRKVSDRGPCTWTGFHFEIKLEPKCVVNDGRMRGITLQQLRDFHQKMKLDFERSPTGIMLDGKPALYDTADVYQVERIYLRPQRQQTGYSYMELISDGEHRPEYHVIYGSKITFKDFMAAIEWHAEARQLPDSAVYYVVPFILDDDTSPRDEEAKFTMRRGPPTKEVLEKHAIGVVMLIDSAAAVLTRCIPAWEAHLGITKGLCFDLAAASGALATTRPFANNAWEFGDFDAALAEMALDFDVATTTGKQPDDRRRYLGEIAGCAWDEVNDVPVDADNYRFWRLNKRLRQKVAGPVLREAGYLGRTAMVDKVVRACPNMNFHNESLRGTLGETAVHTAAASGHTEVLRLLLMLKAAADAPDAMGETPLHYAALAGRPDTARLLLQLNADPEVESFDAETPLAVAMLNPAYFLPGLCMSEVRAVLEQAMKVTRDLDRKRRLLASKTQETEGSNIGERIKQAFTAGGAQRIAPDRMEDVLFQVAGLDKTACGKLVLAAQSVATDGATLDSARFVDWLMERQDMSPLNL